MRDQLQKLLEQRVKQCVSQSRGQLHECPRIEMKKESFARRNAEIVKTRASGKVTGHRQTPDGEELSYRVHFQYLIRQHRKFFLEEGIEERKAEFYKGVLVDDTEVSQVELGGEETAGAFKMGHDRDAEQEMERGGFKYDRLKAVQYAERWWNGHNPAFRKFDVDCTNYISQCIHAGGAPMHGFPNRSNGWWMRSNNWSYSWTVANSLRIYLSGKKGGIKAKEVSSPALLLPGDVICYDFQGDGRFDHTTIVTGRDAEGMPLVNAHTTNSRNRYWAYEDSTAYTPNIKYRFFTIMEEQ